jgi:predicted NAD/FAD-binding protein
LLTFEPRREIVEHYERNYDESQRITQGLGALDSTDQPSWFTTAYFHRPDDFEAEAVEAGVEVVELLGVEGLAAWLPQLEDSWADLVARETILASARAVESEAAVSGVSPHLLLVGRRAPGRDQRP